MNYSKAWVWEWMLARSEDSPDNKIWYRSQLRQLEEVKEDPTTSPKEASASNQMPEDTTQRPIGSPTTAKKKEEENLGTIASLTEGIQSLRNVYKDGTTKINSPRM